MIRASVQDISDVTHQPFALYSAIADAMGLFDDPVQPHKT
jgi:hypothetical protein